MGNFSAIGQIIVLYPATCLLLLSGCFLRSAILAPPFALGRNFQANALVVGDLWATLAAHNIASVLALVAVLLPRLLTYIIVFFLLRHTRAAT